MASRRLPGPLGYSLLDALKGIYGAAQAQGRYTDAYDYLTGQGIQGSGITGYRVGGDAERLAHVLANQNYNQDPMLQARYVALLKQLGYLQHQAY